MLVQVGIFVVAYGYFNLKILISQKVLKGNLPGNNNKLQQKFHDDSTGVEWNGEITLIYVKIGKTLKKTIFYNYLGLSKIPYFLE